MADDRISIDTAAPPIVSTLVTAGCGGALLPVRIAARGLARQGAVPLTTLAMNLLRTPDADGWIRWEKVPDGRFHDLLGDLYFRVTANGVESKMETDRRHTNGLGFLHGGFLMSFVDMAMFTIIRPRFTKGEGAVTLSCATDFLTGGVPGEPIEAHGEVLKETGKLFFVRGLVTQRGANVCSFTGTMRKITRRLPEPVDPAA